MRALSLCASVLLSAACLDPAPPGARCASDIYCLFGSHCGPDGRCVAGLAVHISPDSLTLLPGGSNRFAVAISGGIRGVTWSAPDGGQVTADGLFAAPPTVGTFRVVATSVDDPSASATAVVTTQPITLRPNSANVYVGRAVSFYSGVVGNWSVQEPGGGTVSNGYYTAPLTAGTYHVLFTVNGYVSSALAEVVGPVQITLAPSPARVVLGRKLQFSAAVANPLGGDARVSWSLSEWGACGNLDGNGLYTAPSRVPAVQCAVEAVSLYDTTTRARAPLTLYPPPTVAISPKTAVLVNGGAQQFTATVSGPSGPEPVSWSVVFPGSGSVDANGLYTAPSQPLLTTVRATLRSDPLVSADAQVQVVHGPPNAARSTLTAASSPVHGDGAETFSLSASIADSSGAPVAGAAVVFDLDPLHPLSFTQGGLWTPGAFSGANSSGYAGTTNGSGVLSVLAALRAPAGQTVTVTAHACLMLPCDASSVPLSVDLTFLPTPWVPIDAGLSGAQVNGLADGLGGGVLLAATGQGVFRSADGGATWARSDRGIDGRKVLQVVVAPGSPRFVYALGTDALYESEDGGITWNARPVPYRSAPSALAVDPLNPAILWLSASALYRSADGGLTWTQAWSANGPFVQVLFDPERPGTLYAASVWAGVELDLFKSSDGGATFTQITAGVPGCSWWASPAGSYPLALDPSWGSLLALCQNPRGMFVSTTGAYWFSLPTTPPGSSGLLSAAGGALYVASLGGSVYRSADGAVSWSTVATSSIASGLAGDPSGLAFDGAGRPVVSIAGLTDNTAPGLLRVGADGTLTPSNTGLGPPPLSPPLLVADPQNSGALYLYANGAVLSSADGGDSWQPLGTGLGGTQGTALAVDAAGFSAQGGALWLLERGAARRLLPGESSWALLTNLPDPTTGLSALFTDPVTSGVVYAVELRAARLLKSADAGASWSVVSTPLGGHGAPPRYWASKLGAGSALLGNDGRLARSLDGGATWTLVSYNVDARDQIAQDPADANSFAQVDTLGRTVTTKDAFKTTVQVLSSGYFTRVDFDPSTPGKLWIALGNGAPAWVYTCQSPSGGLVGSGVGLGVGFEVPTGPFVFGPTAGTVYLGFTSGGLFRTTTGGQ